mgnify:CR=1 FL=1|tara:strand:- start:57612 stop:60326 length:2715 start_codon:yes stop_codon:yes gene_type:complete
MTKLIFITFFLFSFSLNTQQLSDIAALESLNDNISNRKINQPNLPNDEIPSDDSIEDLVPKNLNEYTDENYSYLGDLQFNMTQERKSDQQPLQFFGYDYFSNVPNTFAQVKNIPIPPEYLIGPGDNVKVILFGKENNEFTLEVSRSGEIFFPEIGPIYVTGLSFKNMKDTIRKVVTNRIIGTEVNVTLGELRNINIFVLGEAFQPGMYTVSALSTLTNAIFLSGGLRQNGSLRNIQLKRNGEVISTFDFYDLLLNGDTSKDVRLASGDVVFIPQSKKTVGIKGEVFRPAIYELNENESIKDLIRFSGNLKPKGGLNNIELLRVDRENNGFTLLEIDENVANNTLLNNGDVVRILSVANNMNNAVLIRGHFQKSGFYPLSEGLKIGDLITPKNILAMTDLNYVLIKRETASNSYQYIQVDLNEVFEQDTSEENIILQDKDEVILFPRLIMKEQITTNLIKDQRDTGNEQINKQPDLIESMALLRKSIQIPGERINQTSPRSDLSQQEQSWDYYEYRAYNYCVISKESMSKFFTIEGMVDQVNITNICRRQLLDPVLDVIYLQPDNFNKKETVSVLGNVHFPGEYPITENMNLTKVINAAGGLKNNSLSPEIELSRVEVLGKSSLFSNKTYSIAGEASFQDINILGADIVNIKSLNAGTKTIRIDGEVHFPGTYPISENDTIKQLIERAGGLKESAFLPGANFTRQSLRITQLQRLSQAKADLERKIALSTQNTGLGQESSSSASLSMLTELLDADIVDESLLGRLVIDLESIMNNKDDLILKDKDILFIPQIRQSILVLGEVFVPNSHVFDEQKTIKDYISLSGGTNTYADIENIYTIKANGRIVSSTDISSGSGFFRANRDQLEPGDTIVVPLELQPFDTIRATTEISQIVYQMAIAAAAVNSF